MMPLSEIFFLAIVLYVLYRFVFNFVVPVARTARQVKQQFRNMQDMHNQQQDPFQEIHRNHGRHGGATYGPQNGQEPQPKKPSTNNSAGEYIDFEEIK